MIPFELIFVKVLKSVSRLTFCMWLSIVPDSYVEKAPFSIELPLFLCQRSTDYVYVDVFLGCLFCSIEYLS